MLGLLKQPCCLEQEAPAVAARVTVTAADHDAAWHYMSAGHPAAPPAVRLAIGEDIPAAECITACATASDASSASKLLWARTLAALFSAANAVLLPARPPSDSLTLPLRLAVTGPPGSGRSTLATALASKFSLKACAATHLLIPLLTSAQSTPELVGAGLGAACCCGGCPHGEGRRWRP